MIAQLFLTLKSIQQVTTMKLINLLAALSLSSVGFCQYFNVYPDFMDTTSNNQYHYVVEGIEEFPSAGVLHAELLTQDTLLNLISSGAVDLADIGASSGFFVYDATDHRFSFDLGTHPVQNHIIHLWIVIAGEVYNEVYLNN